MVQKRYTKQYHSRLIKELSSLRKGDGISLTKLQDKHALQQLAAYLMNTQQGIITSYQLYTFLLTELSKQPDTDSINALRNALGITSSTPRLSERRQCLADALQKHPDTIERYENQGITTFISSLLENNAPPRSHSPSSYALPPLEKQANTLRHIAALSLSAHLPLGDHAGDLVTYLEHSRDPYLDASVRIVFSPSFRGEEWYQFKLTHTFHGARDTFRVGVVLNSKDGEHLMKAGLIDDFHQPNSDLSMSEIKTIVTNAKLTLKDPTTNTQKLFRLKQLDPETNLHLLQSANNITLGKSCWLYEISIPTEWQKNEIIYEYQSKLTLRNDEPYAYWYSPALMFVKKIVVDFSHFPRAENQQFFLVSFLGYTPETTLEKNHLYVVHINNWIMPGHGLALIWKNTSR